MELGKHSLDLVLCSFTTANPILLLRSKSHEFRWTYLQVNINRVSSSEYKGESSQDLPVGET